MEHFTSRRSCMGHPLQQRSSRLLALGLLDPYHTRGRSGGEKERVRRVEGYLQGLTDRCGYSLAFPCSYPLCGQSIRLVGLIVTAFPSIPNLPRESAPPQSSPEGSRSISVSERLGSQHLLGTSLAGHAEAQQRGSQAVPPTLPTPG